MAKPKSKIWRFIAYWRESISASQEANDMILYVIFLISVGLALVCELAGFQVPGLQLISDPITQKITLLVALLIFLWILFWLPFRRHEAQEREHSESDGFKPIEIHPFSAITKLAANATADQRIGVVKNNLSDFCIEVHNANPTHAIGGIEVRVLKIDPPMQNIGGDFTYSSNEFVLKGDQTRSIRIFTADRRLQHGIFVNFDNGTENCSNAKEEHILTIEVAATGLQTQIIRFKLKFFPNPEQISDSTTSPSTKSKEPVFTVEETTPEALLAAKQEAKAIEAEKLKKSKKDFFIIPLFSWTIGFAH
jgi:hypothetical protein